MTKKQPQQQFVKTTKKWKASSLPKKRSDPNRQGATSSSVETWNTEFGNRFVFGENVFSDQVECHNNVVNTTPTPAEASGLPGKTATACRELWMNACGNSKERERAKHLLHLTYPKYPKITQMREKLLPHDCITLYWLVSILGLQGFKIKRYRRPHKKDIPPDGPQCLSSMWCHLTPACIGCVWHLKFIDL